MIPLAQKCSEAAQYLSGLYGEFALFSLVQWERSAGKWDVVVSAPWLTVDRTGIQQIVDGLQIFLLNDDWLSIASVVPMSDDSPFVGTMLRLFDSEYMLQVHGLPKSILQESGPFTTNDLIVERAIIVAANKSPIAMREYAPVAA